MDLRQLKDKFVTEFGVDHAHYRGQLRVLQHRFTSDTLASPHLEMQAAIYAWWFKDKKRTLNDVAASKHDTADWNKFIAFMGDAMGNDELTSDQRQLFATAFAEHYQHVMRSATNTENLSVNQENDAIHTAMIMVDALWMREKMPVNVQNTQETKAFISSLFVPILIHDMDEIADEISTAHQHATASTIGKPRPIKLPRALLILYLHHQAAAKGIPVDNDFIYSIAQRFKKMGDWDENEPNIIKKLEKFTGIPDIKEWLPVLMGEANAKDFAKIYHLNREEMVLNTAVKAIDRFNGTVFQSRFRELRERWFTPIKQGKAFNFQLLNEMLMFLDENVQTLSQRHRSKMGYFTAQMASQESRYPAARDTRDPENAIHAYPNGLPLHIDYEAEPMNLFHKAAQQHSDPSQRATVLSFYKVMQQEYGVIQNRLRANDKARKKNKQSPEAGLRWLMEKSTLVAPVFQGIGALGLGYAAIHPNDNVKTIANGIAAVGGLGMVPALLKRAALDRSPIQGAAAMLNGKILVDMLQDPSNLITHTQNLVLDMAALNIARYTAQAKPADRHDIVQIKTWDAPLKLLQHTGAEASKTLKFMGSTVKNAGTVIGANIKIATQSFSDTVPDDTKTEKVDKIVNVAAGNVATWAIAAVCQAIHAPAEAVAATQILTGVTNGNEGEIHGNNMFTWAGRVNALSRAGLFIPHPQIQTAALSGLQASFALYSLGLNKANESKGH